MADTAAPLRGPGGRFLSKAEREALTSTDTQVTNTNTDNQENKMSATDTDTGIEFVDELPKIQRRVDSGVWVDRLEPLRENPGKWAKVYGPTNSPHALVNNLRSGQAAGVDPSEFSFAGRILGTTTETDPETGEDREVKEGYVFARFDTDEQRAEREAKEAERAAKREAGEDVDDEDE